MNMAGDVEKRFLGDGKENPDKNWAKIVITVENLTQSEDCINVFYPSIQEVEVQLKEVLLQKYLLPRPIKTEECKVKIKDGKKGTIEIKLKKEHPEIDTWKDWMKD